MGYGDAPWTFRGRAWYQLSLVRADEARRHVPASLPLVELFGWTLGGFYLARYEDSPVGAFDELVALGGLVWDAPVSAAWAARVYVSNPEARRHGLRHVGLPSRLATFSVVEEEEQEEVEGGTEEGQRSSSGADNTSRISWWRPPPPPPQQLGLAATKAAKAPPRAVVVEVRSAGRPGTGRALPVPVCRLRLPPVRAGRLAGTLASPQQQQHQKQQQQPSSWWAKAADGPVIRLALPSFSGGTPDVPCLLKYACALTTNVLPAPLARVEFPRRAAEDEEDREGRAGAGELVDLVLGGRPLVALCFNDMEMRVDEPEPLPAARGGQQQRQQQQPAPLRRGLGLWGKRREREAAAATGAAALA